MPNFVDCAVFRPMATIAEKSFTRQTLEIPEDAFIVGCVAAVKKGHKRIDYLIREFALPPTLKTEDGSREAAKDAKVIESGS